MNDAAHLAIIPKNKRESLVVRLYEYEGHQLADVRAFYAADGDELKPTGKGTSFNVRLLPDVIRGLQKAEKQARERGLIP